MPRRPTRTVATVLIPSPIGDQPADWPQWLGQQLAAAGREVRVCPPPEPAAPQPAAWLATLAGTLAGLPDDGFDVLAHSVGCLLWLHHAAGGQHSPRPARVALIAPPSAAAAPAGWAGLFPAPLSVDALRKAADGTVLVGSDNDPHCPGGTAAVYGSALKMATTMLGGAGSLTAESGYGPWPAVLDWCGRDNLAFIG